MATLRLSPATAVMARSAVAVATALRTGSMRFASTTATASAMASPAPPLKDALSGIFGSVSLAAWICLLLPQLIQNYKSQNAEGLSMAFLFVWLVGDITNLSGAICTGLAPTAIALASYFSIADLVLISQCLYYNAKTARRGRTRRDSSFTVVADDVAVMGDGGTGNGQHVGHDEDEDGAEGQNMEDSPLVPNGRRDRRRSSSIGLPGSHRRHSMRHTESSLDPLRRIVTGEDDTPDSNPWLHNTLSLLSVWLVGTVGYFASYRLGAWDVAVPGDGPAALPAAPSPSPTTVADELYGSIGMALGYFSAVCYLCARIPQIIKNYREKSCEGLALLFFLLSLTGNFTYGASLVAYSQEPSYLVKALPWLMGSLGTMVEDCIIFVQFRIYSPKRVVNKIASTDSAVDACPVGSYGAA